MKSTKTRYSDSELQEFKGILLEKLKIAKAELKELMDSSKTPTENGNRPGEAAADSFEKENTLQLANHQQKFVHQLESALIRIENKTYGICREKQTLIPKERLRAVPHTTMCIEAKMHADAA